MVTAIGLIIVGIILIVLAYFLPIPQWAKGLLYAIGVIALIVGIILFVLPYLTGLMVLPITY